MNAPIQTEAASRLARANEAATNPQVPAPNQGQPEEYSSPGMYDPGAAGGDTNPGILIYLADGTQEFIPNSEIYPTTDEANWSLEFAVSFSGLVAFATTAPFGTANTTRFDGDESAAQSQTYYRIPVIRTISGVKYTFDIGGVYRENIFCSGSKGPIAELVRIG